MNRGGPGLGDIGPAQGDYYQSTRGGGHGDYRTLVLAPSTCQEAYDMMIEAFDLAFAYRNPVMILGDGIVGAMKEPVTLWKPEKTDDKTASWHLDGARGREKRLIRSLFLEEGALARHNRHLAAKYALMQKEARAETFLTDDADLIVVAYGSMGRIAKSGVRTLREAALKVGLVRPVTLYPFPSDVLERLAAKGRRFLTIEQNTGQMVDDVRLAIRRHADSDFFGIMPGDMPGAEDLMVPMKEILGRKK
jgi:2-oxoglutarate ferredoxin oxidoreductase subunit alpha